MEAAASADREAPQVLDEGDFEERRREGVRREGVRREGVRREGVSDEKEGCIK
jgi:hypothetical protein